MIFCRLNPKCLINIISEIPTFPCLRNLRFLFSKINTVNQNGNLRENNNLNDEEKRSTKDRNVRLKIGKSTFFLPTEESNFVEKFTKTLSEDSSDFVPIPPGKIFRKFVVVGW